MQRNKKFYIVGYDSAISRMMVKLGHEVIFDRDKADIVIFTGGADVNPKFYGHKMHPTTSANTARDVEEIRLFQKTREDQLKVGICRGSQLLCVLNGGTLYQDVDRHGIYGTHDCTYIDEKGQEKTYQVTSTHHQMQNPYFQQAGLDELKFELWGHADRSTYRDQQLREHFVLGSNDHPDVEILYWPDTHCLGFQGHPEYDSEECRELFGICLDRALNRKG